MTHGSAARWVLCALAWPLAAACVIQYEVRETELAASSSGDDVPSTSAAAGSDESGDAPTDSGGPLACDPEESICDAACVQLDIHPDHCGGCGVVCAPDLACDRGECRDGCRNGKEICARYCVDLDEDPEHCGTCSMVCPDGGACDEGQCQAPCDPPCDPERQICDDGLCVCADGLTACLGVCVDTDSDPAHCGGCEQPCDGAEVCDDGECGPGR